MYTLAQLDGLNLDGLPLPRRIEASASVRVYLDTYAEHKLDPPAWLTDLARALRANLREVQKEQEVGDVQAARRRVWNRLPTFERQQAIQAEIAALEAELESP